MRVLTFLFALGVAGGVYALASGRLVDSVGQSSAPELQADDPRLLTGDKRIVMLAAEWCGYCRKQQQDFERANVRYRVLDVDTPEGSRAAQALGLRGVPITVLGQNVVAGYDTEKLQIHLKPLGYNVY
ncbi:MAG: glutaredoxin family protein [Lysobacter sp.]